MDEQHIHNMHKFEGRKKYLFFPVIVIFNILLVFLIVWLGVDIHNRIKESKYIGRDIESRDTITVSDKGEVYARPDLALVTFSVVTEAKTVEEAMTDNTKKMNAVIEFIKSEGVEDKDLKTISFNIYPRYEWQEKASCVPPCPSGKRVLVGYEIRQSLQVKIRDMGKIGGIVEGATASGVNEVGDLQFTIDNEDELKKQARNEAIEKTKAKAEELASKLGVNLVRITNFSESGTFPRFYAFPEAMEGVGGGGETPQIETGENKIEVNVNITYEIN